MTLLGCHSGVTNYMKGSIRKGHVPSETDTLWPHWECIKDVTIVSINRVDYNHSFNPFHSDLMLT